jgi:hypothetical protein
MKVAFLIGMNGRFWSFYIIRGGPGSAKSGHSAALRCYSISCVLGVANAISSGLCHTKKE